MNRKCIGKKDKDIVKVPNLFRGNLSFRVENLTHKEIIYLKKMNKII